jgi:hypothetical protein
MLLIIKPFQTFKTTKMKNIIGLFLCLLTLLQAKTVVSQTSYTIATDKIYINALDPVYQAVKPGDTLYFVGGNKDYLLIANFRGAPGKPIVMINKGGNVIIDTDHYYGISIQNCRYIKFTGTGNPGQTYGFQVKRVANGAGMGIGNLSSDFEIDHVSIENTLIGGLYAKTDPDCDLLGIRANFTQYNTIIHDNYISHAGNEGMYIGSTKCEGQSVFCNGKDTLLMPSLLDGVQVYNNIVEYAGWDGIQVSSAYRNCKIYNNTVLYDSQAEATFQMSGIIMGGGTRADCYNNFISQGKGDGIECHGLGGCRIFNNIILDAGRTYLPADPSQMKHGMYISDVSVEQDSSFYIQNNDIINPKSDGIRFSSIKSKNNLIASNVIINPGSFDYYQNGNTRFKGIDSYVMLQDIGTNVNLQNNYLARNTDSVKFVSSSFTSPNDLKLMVGSPLIDKVEIDKHILFDFAGSPRPSGVKSDIGAFEYKDGIVVAVKPLIQNVTGGGGYCIGGTGVNVELSNSQTGVQYQLLLNGTKTGTAVNGTGSAISFGLQTLEGSYTATGTFITTSVISTMSGSATVTIIALPAPAAIGGLKSGCAGTTIPLTDATAGGVWSSLTPSIATISSAGIVTGIVAGTATIQYTITNPGGCTNNVSTTFIVNSAVRQPGKFTKSTSRIELGQSNVVYTVPNVSGVTYNWRYSGTGATITGTTNSVLISYSLTARSGTLSVTASNACGTSNPRSMSISILKGAILPIDSLQQTAMANSTPFTELTASINELKVYPNPAAGQATFEFQIDKNDHVTLEIYSVSGQQMARIFDAQTEAGIPQKVSFQQSLPTGIYSCVMRWSGKMISTKLIIIHSSF